MLVNWTVNLSFWHQILNFHSTSLQSALIGKKYTHNNTVDISRVPFIHPPPPPVAIKLSWHWTTPGNDSSSRKTKIKSLQHCKTWKACGVFVPLAENWNVRIQLLACLTVCAACDRQLRAWKMATERFGFHDDGVKHLIVWLDELSNIWWIYRWWRGSIDEKKNWKAENTNSKHSVKMEILSFQMSFLFFSFPPFHFVTSTMSH